MIYSPYKTLQKHEPYSITLEWYDITHHNIMVEWVMVFNSTFNNTSVTSWLSVLLGEETGEPGENHQPKSNYHTIMTTTTPYKTGTTSVVC